MVKNIVQFLQEIDIKVIAEYVHCEEVYDVVQELNIDGFQGFFLFKPLDSVPFSKD